MIRYDQNWKAAIVKREDATYERWKQKMLYHQDEWHKHVMKRTDPGGAAEVPEQVGDYYYNLTQREFPESPGEVSGQKYDLYIRVKADNNYRSVREAEENAEVVLDICDIPYIPHKLLRRTVIEGFKISDDHSLIAFKLDIGNTEKVTAGFKDMVTGKVLKTKLNNVGDIIFGCGSTVFYTECDESNRPYKVVRFDVKNGESSTIFMDDNPTHYVDIGITKDKKFIVINSNTKEDSEVWVAERSETN